MTRRSLPKVLILAATTLAPAPVLAQLQGSVIDGGSRGVNTSVTQRDRPEYDTPGLYAGGFLISPEIAVDTGYSDNVYLTKNNRVADGFVSLRPKLTANSTWSQNALAASVSGDFRRYFDNPIRNEDNFGAAVQGRYDAAANATLSTSAQFDRSYESQYDVTSINVGASSIPVNSYGGTLLAGFNRGRFRMSLAGIVSRLDYGDYTTLTGGRVSQDTRDRVGVAGAGQIDYSIAVSASAFVQLGYENYKYDNALGLGLQNRNSEAIRAIAGVSFDLTRFIRGRFGAGYIDRNYVSPAYKDVKGLTVEAKLEYFLSDLTTITADAHRVIEDAAVLNLGGYFRTGGGIRIDHELLRNLLLNGRASYDFADYSGGGNNVRVWRLAGGAKFLINRHLSASSGISYGNRDQSGTAPGESFNELRGSLSVGYRF